MSDRERARPPPGYLIFLIYEIKFKKKKNQLSDRGRTNRSRSRSTERSARSESHTRPYGVINHFIICFERKNNNN